MNSDVRNQISPDHTMYNYWLQKLIHLSNREINSGSFALGKKRSQQLNGRKVFSSITDDTMWRSFSRSIELPASSESVKTNETISFYLKWHNILNWEWMKIISDGFKGYWFKLFFSFLVVEIWIWNSKSMYFALLFKLLSWACNRFSKLHAHEPTKSKNQDVNTNTLGAISEKTAETSLLWSNL